MLAPDNYHSRAPMRNVMFAGVASSDWLSLRLGKSYEGVTDLWYLLIGSRG